ncbi:MAG: hypothetical protein WCH21_12695 [Bacteroidota bacterium]
MSSYFNYDLEERNMRNQLKELEMPFKEDAWHSYEAYAKQFQGTRKAQLLPNFNFALNRTIVLPIVFGGIIVLFSFLLFNFINIKNTKSSKTEISEVKEAVVPSLNAKQKPEPKKEVAAQIVKEEIPKTESEIITNSIAATLLKNNANEVVKIIPTTITNTALIINPIVTNTLAQNLKLAKPIPTYTFDSKNKKRKKGKAEVLKSIATPISLPTATKEEAEPELR